MKKNAFSLAEVLAVTAIIGVIAAITMPTIGIIRANDHKILYRKAYKTLEQFCYEMVNDEDLYPYDSINYGFKNTTPIIHLNKTFGTPSKFRELLKTKFEITKEFGDEFTTNDGIVWTVPNSDFSLGYHDISIDVNGEKKPNCYYDPTSTEERLKNCKEPDQLRFRVTNRGMIELDDNWTKEREYIDINRVINSDKSQGGS